MSGKFIHIAIESLLSHFAMFLLVQRDPVINYLDNLQLLKENLAQIKAISKGQCEDQLLV